jgi:ribosomal protein L44E
MSKKYTFEFDETAINELNTALRIMYCRRANQHKYIIKQLGPDEKINTTTRKKERFFSVVDGKLQFEETQFIPTRKTPVKKVVIINSD